MSEIQLQERSKDEIFNIAVQLRTDNFIKEKKIEELEKQLQQKDKEIERLNKENNELIELYRRTCNHLFSIGNDELARYFQAQINECPIFITQGSDKG